MPTPLGAYSTVRRDVRRLPMSAVRSSSRPKNTSARPSVKEERPAYGELCHVAACPRESTISAEGRKSGLQLNAQVLDVGIEWARQHLDRELTPEIAFGSAWVLFHRPGV